MNLNLFEDRNKTNNEFVEKFIKELKDTLVNFPNNQIINNEGQNLQNNTKELNKVNSSDLKQEDCLYQVVEIDTDGVYLQNIDNNHISKETDISKDVLDQIGEDSVLKFKDGQYTFEENLTQKFLNSLTDIKEYMDIKEKFIKESNISEIDSNTKFQIESCKDDYYLLSYQNGMKNTIEVPKALIPFWTKNGDALYYKDGKFERES